MHRMNPLSCGCLNDNVFAVVLSVSLECTVCNLLWLCKESYFRNIWLLSNSYVTWKWKTKNAKSLNYNALNLKLLVITCIRPTWIHNPKTCINVRHGFRPFFFNTAKLNTKKSSLHSYFQGRKQGQTKHYNNRIHLVWIWVCIITVSPSW